MPTRRRRLRGRLDAEPPSALPRFWPHVAAGLLVCIVFLLPLSARAQADGEMSQESATEQLIESYQPSTAAADQKPLPQSQVSAVSLTLTWRDWREALLEGETKVDTLDTVRHHAVGLGYRNVPRYAFASLAELRAPSTLEGLDRRQLLETLGRIELLAPELPYVRLERARLLLSKAPTRLDDVVGSYAMGVYAGFQWPNTRVAWTLKYLLFGLVAWLAALSCFLLGQALRHLGPISRDLQRLLPSAFSKQQVLLLLGLAVLAPSIVFESPLLGVALLLIVVSPPQHWSERLVSLLFFATIALVPTIDGLLADLVSFEGSESRRLLEAQYLHCGDPCLDAFADADTTPDETDGGDPVRRYTQALVRIRAGAPSDVERALHRLQETDFPASLRGYAHNLVGAAMVARGRVDAAIDPLEEATAELPKAPAPWFNLMRAHQKGGEPTAAKKAFNRAVERDLSAVSRAKGRPSEDPASFLMLDPLPRDVFWERHRRRHTSEPPPLETAWRTAAGSFVPLERAPLFAGAGALLLLLTWLFRFARWVSTPCPHCGMAREPGDPDKTQGHPHCYPCFRTFFGGGDLQYDTRRHYEKMLERRVQLFTYLRRGLSVLAPGAGHAVAGHPLTGLFLTATTVFGVLLILDPAWSWEPPYALFYEDWLGAWIFGSLLLLVAAWLIYVAARHDIVPHDETS